MREDELAEDCVAFLREYVHTENRLLQEEHDFFDKVLSIGHLLQALGEGEEGGLFQKLHDVVTDLTVYMEDEQLTTIRFVKEAELILKHLEDDKEHRGWVAVLHDVEAVPGSVKTRVVVEIAHLDKLHSYFIQMRKLIRSHNPDIHWKHLQTTKRHASHEMHYYISVYKFCRLYERVFRHLLAKEKRLVNKLGRDVRKQHTYN